MDLYVSVPLCGKAGTQSIIASSGLIYTSAMDLNLITAGISLNSLKRYYKKSKTRNNLMNPTFRPKYLNKKTNPSNRMQRIELIAGYSERLNII